MNIQTLSEAGVLEYLDAITPGRHRGASVHAKARSFEAFSKGFFALKDSSLIPEVAVDKALNSFRTTLDDEGCVTSIEET